MTCVTARRVDARDALTLARANSRFPDEWVVAACKDDGQPPIITMTLEDFVSLLGEWQANRKRSKPIIA